MKCCGGSINLMDWESASHSLLCMSHRWYKPWLHHVGHWIPVSPPYTLSVSITSWKNLQIPHIAWLTKNVASRAWTNNSKISKKCMKLKIKSINLHNFTHRSQSTTPCTPEMNTKTQKSFKITIIVRPTKNWSHGSDASVSPTFLFELSGASRCLPPMRGTSKSLHKQY